MTDTTQAYLVVCDHAKKLVFGYSEVEARACLDCEDCVTDVRVYQATEDDLRVFGENTTRKARLKVRYKTTQQTDWVNEVNHG